MIWKVERRVCLAFILWKKQSVPKGSCQWVLAPWGHLLINVIFHNQWCIGRTWKWEKVKYFFWSIWFVQQWNFSHSSAPSFCFFFCFVNLINSSQFTPSILRKRNKDFSRWVQDPCDQFKRGIDVHIFLNVAYVRIGLYASPSMNGLFWNFCHIKGLPNYKTHLARQKSQR